MRLKNFGITTFLSAETDVRLPADQRGIGEWLARVGGWLRLHGRRRFMRRVVQALRAGRRAGIASDERRLQKISSHLDLEWNARDVHPWDRDLPRERQAELLATQLLEDTVSVIRRLFNTLPEVDTIRISVREPSEPHNVLLEGTVTRAALRRVRECPSPAMSLKLLGVYYRLIDGSLEPLEQGQQRAV
jgi:hypothetical protein